MWERPGNRWKGEQGPAARWSGHRLPTKQACELPPNPPRPRSERPPRARDSPLPEPKPGPPSATLCWGQPVLGVGWRGLGRQWVSTEEELPGQGRGPGNTDNSGVGSHRAEGPQKSRCGSHSITGTPDSGAATCLPQAHWSQTLQQQAWRQPPPCPVSQRRF